MIENTHFKAIHHLISNEEPSESLPIQSDDLISQLKQELRASFGNDQIVEHMRLRNEFNEQSLLTRDPFFQDSAFFPPFPGSPSFLYGTLPPAPKDSRLLKLISQIDMTRITNRLIIAGLFWKEKTDKTSKRNNLGDGATFLNQRFGEKYMIWNLAGN